MAHPSGAASVTASTLEFAPWKTVLTWICALLMAVLFIASGGWKILYPIDWSARIMQMQVPGVLAMPATLAVGIAEIFGGVLILVPRFRRWGAYVLVGLLVAFMVFVGVQYNVLRGADCSCFPWLKRTVGPMFFVTDALMIVAVVVAGWWAQPSRGLRSAALVLGAIAVFAGASYGITMAQQTGLKAPEAVMVNGKPYSLGAGKVLLYFFDPECAHCLEAAKRMAEHTWIGTRIVAVPTRVFQFADQFMADTKLKAEMTSDVGKLREVFQFNDPPYAVLLEHGRQKEAFVRFDEAEPATRLRALGAIE